MKSRMTKSQAKGFMARWELVNRAERDELRATPTEQKARQLAALMQSAKEFGGDERPGVEEAEVRERWNELRRRSRKET